MEGIATIGLQDNAVDCSALLEKKLQAMRKFLAPRLINEVKSLIKRNRAFFEDISSFSMLDVKHLDLKYLNKRSCII